MVAVAAVALFIPAYQRVFYYNNEPDRSLLEPGDEVVVFGVQGESVGLLADPDLAEMKRLGFITARQAVAPSQVRILPTGTRCAVITDYAGDRDGCSTGDREVVVEVVEGRYKGLVAPIMRWSLRPR
jgi:hypothetical protein